MSSRTPRADAGNAMRMLQEARVALEEATQACDEAFRAQGPAPDPVRDREALQGPARFFSDAQRRLVHAQALLRHARPSPSQASESPPDKAWGSH